MLSFVESVADCEVKGVAGGRMAIRMACGKGKRSTNEPLAFFDANGSKEFPRPRKFCGGLEPFCGGMAGRRAGGRRPRLAVGNTWEKSVLDAVKDFPETALEADGSVAGALQGFDVAGRPARCSIRRVTLQLEAPQ
jgi:hypothetical protein